MKKKTERKITDREITIHKITGRKITAIALAGCLAGGAVLCGCGGEGANLGAGKKPVELTADAGSSSASICTDGAEDGVTSAVDFSYQLFKENLAETNPVMSPVSAYFAMSMVGAGAKGDTQAEFHNVFGEDMIDVSGNLMGKLPAAGENLRVNIANSAWVDDNLAADDTWLEVVKGVYKGEVYQMPLTSAMEPINQWVSDKTEGLIDSILDEPLNGEARLAVINAIYFNGKWMYTFEPEATSPETFYMEGGKSTDIDMMHSYGVYFQYLKGAGFDGVVMPYQDGDYAFVAVKPTEGQSVRQMYEGLDMGQMADMIANSQNELVNIKLPKFEVEYDKVLNQDFINMGVKTAFEAGKADLSGLGTSDDGLPLFISLVRQKAVLKVDEEGTEAAAVTSVIVECGSAMPVDEPIDVFFDEPFFYMVYDTGANVPLFMGIFEEPIE